MPKEVFPTAIQASGSKGRWWIGSNFSTCQPQVPLNYNPSKCRRDRKATIQIDKVSISTKGLHIYRLLIF